MCNIHLLQLLYSIYIYCSILHNIQYLPSTERPAAAGQGKRFTADQKAAIVQMVLRNNTTRVRGIQAAVMADHNNIQSVSVSSIDRALKHHNLTMKQIYRVPDERNSDWV